MSPRLLHKPSACTAGFSLIELAIFLLVVGILASFALTSGISQQSFARQKQTYDKMAVIESAIAAYVRLNGHLPCPALPTLARTDPNIGKENCNVYVSLASPGTISAPGTSALIHEGAVPTAALMLSQDFMLDGWDNRFLYAVDPAFITARLFANAVEQATPTGNGFITIINATTALAVPTVAPASTDIRTDGAAYVLMSFGEDGVGAYPRDGGTTRIGVTPTNPAQLVNFTLSDPGVAPNKKYFAQGLFNPTPNTLVTHFDDIVHYRRKYQVAREAGAIVGGTLIRTSGSNNTLLDDCAIAKLTLMPIANPNSSAACTNSTAAAGTNCKPLEGPVGCEDIKTIKAATPANTSNIGGHWRVNATGLVPATYVTLSRQTDCIAHQMKLAEKVYERCIAR